MEQLRSTATDFKKLHCRDMVWPCVSKIGRTLYGTTVAHLSRPWHSWEMLPELKCLGFGIALNTEVKSGKQVSVARCLATSLSKTEVKTPKHQKSPDHSGSQQHSKPKKRKIKPIIEKNRCLPAWVLWHTLCPFTESYLQFARPNTETTKSNVSTAPSKNGFQNEKMWRKASG